MGKLKSGETIAFYVPNLFNRTRPARKSTGPYPRARSMSLSARLRAWQQEAGLKKGLENLKAWTENTERKTLHKKVCSMLFTVRIQSVKKNLGHKSHWIYRSFVMICFTDIFVETQPQLVVINARTKKITGLDKNSFPVVNKLLRQ